MRQGALFLAMLVAPLAMLVATINFASWPAFAADAVSLSVAAPTTVRQSGQQSYYWKNHPVTGGAQILTLFCHSCAVVNGSDEDVPLVAVLRDTLGDSLVDNDRLRYVWLLSYVRPTTRQKALSAVPFFYWRVGGPSQSKGIGTAALMDVSQPADAVFREAGRDLLQWAALDALTTPVRASSRAYRTNAMDHERLHLEEAISYLREAPPETSNKGLTTGEIDTVIARLSLRKRLLGGLVPSKRAQQIGREDSLDQEKARSRNWEMLRQLAERTGLLAESIDVANSNDQYGILWYPLGQEFVPSAVPLKPVWKLLNIKDPWSDDRLRNEGGHVFTRSIDASGALLPEGMTGAHEVRLAPLSVYNLNYPKLPLLLVDFRDKTRTRRAEMTQRTIDEVASGVVGLSHFTNWYFYVGQAAYQFVLSRHGAALDRSERLDCYSQFRVALALDRRLDPELRSEMQKRVDSLALNPLETAPDQEIRIADTRYRKLIAEAGAGGQLEKRLERDRRAELANFGKNQKSLMGRQLAHDLSFGAYTSRVKAAPENLVDLDRNRRVQSSLDFLDSLVEARIDPAVAYGDTRVRASVTQLGALMAGMPPSNIKEHALVTLDKLSLLSADAALRADCVRARDGIETGALSPPIAGSVAEIKSFQVTTSGSAVPESRK